MGLFDWLGSAFDWVSDNADVITPMIELGGGLWSYNNARNSQQDYFDMLRDQENRNYQEAQEARDYYEGESEEEEGENEALVRESIARQLEAYRRAQELFKPFQETAVRLLPQMEKVYSQGLTNMSNLWPIVANSDALSNLQKQPQTQLQNVPIGLPNYLMGSK